MWVRLRPYLHPTVILPVHTDISILPNVVVYGKTHTLHQAMVRDESGQLKKLVQDYVTCADRVERVALTEKIVYAWTGQDQVLATETQKKFDLLGVIVGSSFFPSAATDHDVQ